MEYQTTEEYQNRLRKLGEIRALGIEPYPYRYSPSHDSSELHEKYDSAKVGESGDAEAGTTPLVSIAGRLVLFRAMGKNAFATIQDKSGRMQVMFNREFTEVVGLAKDGEPPLKFIEKKIDLGDIVGVEGYLFHTHKGELTVFAKKFTLLCKTLLPLPENIAGLLIKRSDIVNGGSILFLMTQSKKHSECAHEFFHSSAATLKIWAFWKLKHQFCKTSMVVLKQSLSPQSSSHSIKRCTCALLLKSPSKN